jgi:hypothetical protein
MHNDFVAVSANKIISWNFFPFCQGNDRYLENNYVATGMHLKGRIRNVKKIVLSKETHLMFMNVI